MSTKKTALNELRQMINQIVKEEIQLMEAPPEAILPPGVKPKPYGNAPTGPSADNLVRPLQNALRDLVKKAEQLAKDAKKPPYYANGKFSDQQIENLYDNVEKLKIIAKTFISSDKEFESIKNGVFDIPKYTVKKGKPALSLPPGVKPKAPLPPGIKPKSSAGAPPIARPSSTSVPPPPPPLPGRR